MICGKKLVRSDLKRQGTYCNPSCTRGTGMRIMFQAGPKQKHKTLTEKIHAGGVD